MMRVFFAYLALMSSLAWAQPEADRLLAEALAKAETAKVTYSVATFDQPLWREAILLATEVLKQNPQNLAALHFLASSYTQVSWYSRAWDHWLAFFQAGGSLQLALQLDTDSEKLLETAGTELGFANYQSGKLAEALSYYEQVLSYLPNNTEALRWLGRIYFERGETATSLAYWQNLNEQLPEDESAKYYLMLVRQEQAVGRAASNAFQQGLQAYEKGDIRAAQGFFENAVLANNQFKDALSWAGRSSFELGQVEKAAAYWQKVLALDPSDETAAYFSRYASDRAEWGEAADAFYRGQALHLQANYQEAVNQFEEAFRLNPNYKDAAVWTARTYQELAQPGHAKVYWELVLKLDPQDKRAQDFLRLADVQTRSGMEAGNAFLEGVAAFEAARLSEAEDFFVKALAANPNFADAWAWLGRVHFSIGEYTKAAEEYGRAYQLEPGNEGYRFFANESLRLKASQ